ncbi:NmrA/HSCARG family protein [Ornithinimicrobium avium]|uniref:NmrA/HSCARG family protein n=1 Tax=Ornithinimicrobium avium TaxID=2283195 RepID=A0A345NLP0_9MICO|nr:NmrA/HSCARG family protein [Ornithinimicrobium avium]AXH95948.1 NmrA/HSCARG family protein [Ornithinimicrobium avium]
MQQTRPPVLVLGATGGQGGAVVDALLTHRSPVRALVRDPASPAARRLRSRGVEVVPGSLDDRDSLSTAMRGVANVFAVTTPFEAGAEAEVAQGRAILGAAGDARVPHLVLSSVAGADEDSGVPHFESKAVIERELVAGQVPHTILGPVYFFDNALGGKRQILEGVLELPLPADRPLQQLARRDLGRFAAAVLLSPEAFAGRRIELASDDPTPARMATALGSALGRQVRHEEIPLSSIDDPDMHAMWRFLADKGYRVDLPALHGAHPDLSWTSFADWASMSMEDES